MGSAASARNRLFHARSFAAMIAGSSAVSEDEGVDDEAPPASFQLSTSAEQGRTGVPTKPVFAGNVVSRTAAVGEPRPALRSQRVAKVGSGIFTQIFHQSSVFCMSTLPLLT